jgi:hypothetical protein
MTTFILSLFINTAAAEDTLDCSTVTDVTLKAACELHNSQIKRTDAKLSVVQAHDDTQDVRIAQLEAKANEPRPEPPAVADATDEAPTVAPTQVSSVRPAYVLTSTPAAAMTGARPSMRNVRTIVRPSEVAGAGALVCANSGGWLEMVGPDTVQVYADTVLDGYFRPDPVPHTCAWASTAQIHVVAPASNQVLLYYMVESRQGVNGVSAFVVQKVLLYDRGTEVYARSGFTQASRGPKQAGEL